MDRGRTLPRLCCVCEIHVPRIAAAAAKVFQSETDKVPAYLQAVVAHDLRKQFLLTHYFDILASVFNEDTQPEPFRFEPELHVDSLPDPVLREHATQVVAHVRKAHVPLIAEAVRRAYAADMDKVPEYLRTGLEDSLRRHFLLEQYFPIVFLS